MWFCWHVMNRWAVPFSKLPPKKKSVFPKISNFSEQWPPELFKSLYRIIDENFIEIFIVMNIEMIQKWISLLAASLRIIWDFQTGNWSRNSINGVIIAALKWDWMDGVDVGDAVGVACLVGVACSRIDDVIDVFSADDEWRARLLLLIFFRIFLRWRFFFSFSSWRWQVRVDWEKRQESVKLIGSSLIEFPKSIFIFE